VPPQPWHRPSPPPSLARSEGSAGQRHGRRRTTHPGTRVAAQDTKAYGRCRNWIGYRSATIHSSSPLDPGYMDKANTKPRARKRLRPRTRFAGLTRTRHTKRTSKSFRYDGNDGYRRSGSRTDLSSFGVRHFLVSHEWGDLRSRRKPRETSSGPFCSPETKSPEILGSLEKGLGKTAGVQSPYIIGPSRLSRL
jgi:hypothetical protein